ncbi:VOC family protein [Massilia niastensis]|uniref:VOC family protein n=1 Tax=Massilia niastensis TaxID=544911 RepID=UPI0004775A26|nr:VOC family protein [Massilia niastensis]
MLSNKEAIATIGVRDVEAARKFYGNVLGLQEDSSAGDKCEGVVCYLSGKSRIFVYESKYAGTNQATVVTWDVGAEIGEIVAALKAKGASFEHYEMEGMRLEGDIHVGDQMKVVWLKDPDGNILSINGK